MKRYRQWLAEQQNHMTESPDGEYYLVIEVDAALAEKEGRVRKCEDLAVEWKIVALDYNEQIAALNPCGHTGFESASCNVCGYPDPRKLIAALTESRNHWKRQWRLMEAAEKKAEEKIDTLTTERDRQNDFIDKVEMAYPEFYEHHKGALRGGEEEIMICKDCDGRGDFKNKSGEEVECLVCNGTGSICDICGEPSESGMDKCENCG